MGQDVIGMAHYLAAGQRRYDDGLDSDGEPHAGSMLRDAQTQTDPPTGTSAVRTIRRSPRGERAQHSVSFVLDVLSDAAGSLPSSRRCAGRPQSRLYTL